MTSQPSHAFSRSEWLVLLALASLTLVSFWPVGGCGFVDLDDHGYVAGNGFVKSGLTRAGLIWAFVGFHAGHWIPLTWLSLMADAEIFGTTPAGFHWTNLFLHVCNVLLLFLVLRRATGSLWRSALVAALFGVHPLRVESVAWITERKDVLAGFFGFAALALYVQYARRPTWPRYGAILALFVLSLMAKPMLVTLPILMLLLDYWPLGRLRIPFAREAAAALTGTGGPAFPRADAGPASSGSSSGGGGGGSIPVRLLHEHELVESECLDARRSLGSLILEKAPLLAAAAAGSVIASVAQGRTAAASLEAYGIAERAGNAVVSYVRYLVNLISFHRLAVFYPVHPLPAWLVLIDALLLAVASALILARWKRAPWLFVGWLWFILTMLPMIGLVQIGQQAMADRFSYFPTIGVLMMIVWSIPRGVVGTRPRRTIAWGAVAMVLLALSISTWRQSTYWKDSATLFQHAVDVTEDNYMAYTYLGATQAMHKDYESALHNLLTASRINPGYNFAQNNLGSVLAEMGRTREAIAQFELALRTNPVSDNAHFNLGLILSKVGRSDDAIEHFRQALEVNPDHVLARYRLGVELQRRGETQEAIEHLQKALLMSPDTAEIHDRLGTAYEERGQLEAAIAAYQRSLQLAPRFADASLHLGAALTQKGEIDQAIVYLERALQLRPNDTVARSYLERALASREQGRKTD